MAEINRRPTGLLLAQEGTRNSGPGPGCGLGAEECAARRVGWAARLLLLAHGGWARARFGPRARKRASGPRAEKKSAAGKQAFGLKMYSD
jgi:hypothetical protein